MIRNHDDRARMQAAPLKRTIAIVLAATALLLAWTSIASAGCFYNASPHVVRMAHVDLPSKSIVAEHVLRAQQAICFPTNPNSTFALYSDIIARSPHDYAELHKRAVGALGQLYVNSLNSSYYHVIPKDWIFAVSAVQAWGVIELRPRAYHWFKLNERILERRGEVPLGRVFDARLQQTGILNQWAIQMRSPSAPTGGAPAAPTPPTVTVACPRETIARAKSAYTWVRFNLPQGRPGEVVDIPGGARNKYVFPTCHRVVWSDHVYRCSNTGSWTLVRGDAKADILCHGGTPNSPYIQTGEN